MESIILDDHRFWKAIKFCMKCVLPLVKVLIMGYIYEAMDRAKPKTWGNKREGMRKYGMSLIRDGIINSIDPFMQRGLLPQSQVSY